MSDQPTDLVEIAEREVIEAARTWYRLWWLQDTQHVEANDLSLAECKVHEAITLLESREQMKQEETR